MAATAPSLRRRGGRLISLCALLGAVGGCRSGGEPPSLRYPGGGTAVELRAALTGAWAGEFGKLWFAPDGTAGFAGRRCAVASLVLPAKLGPCEAINIVGPVEIADHQIRIRASAPDPSGPSVLAWAAYLSRDGRLHLGQGVVAALASRRGAVALRPGLVLEIGERCEIAITPVVGEGEPRGAPRRQPVPCRFERASDLEVLTFEAPTDPSSPVGTPQALVYLPEAGLLVSPWLTTQSYARN